MAKQIFRSFEKKNLNRNIPYQFFRCKIVPLHLKLGTLLSLCFALSDAYTSKIIKSKKNSIKVSCVRSKIDFRVTKKKSPLPGGLEPPTFR